MTKSAEASKLQRSVVEFLVRGFGVSRLRPAPGTWGTAVAVLLVVLLHAVFPALASPLAGAALACAVALLAVWLSSKACDYELFAERAHDPSEIVIDEIAGFFVTVIALPVDPLSLVLAFLAFRLFDIAKPFPVRRLEMLPKGLGIVADDLAAGVYANLSVQLLLLI